MSEKLEWLSKLKNKLEESEDSDMKLDALKIDAFLAMAKYLSTRSMEESFALIDTILEGDDLKREVTLIHEKINEDMDKVFEIIRQKIPTESQKAEKMIESIDNVLKLIQETRAEKAANA